MTVCFDWPLTFDSGTLISILNRTFKKQSIKIKSDSILFLLETKHLPNCRLDQRSALYLYLTKFLVKKIETNKNIVLTKWGLQSRLSRYERTTDVFLFWNPQFSLLEKKKGVSNSTNFCLYVFNMFLPIIKKKC